MIDSRKRSQLVRIRLAEEGLRMSVDENLFGTSLPYEYLYLMYHSEIDFIIIKISFYSYAYLDSST